MNQLTNKIPGNNETTVGIGAVAGATVTILLWIVNTYLLPEGATPAPAEIGAAATVVVTAIVQRIVPKS